MIGAALWTTMAVAADPAHPTVVELYQSQGCSSCPPADVVVNALANRPDVLALSFAVTYWDRLGWKDTFGDPAFTKRQADYAGANRQFSISTPEVIINGRGAVVGNRKEEVDAAIARLDRGTTGPEILSNGKVVLIRAMRGSGTLWLVRYDPRTIAVPIGAGENGGRTIPHRNIVRQLIALGQWNGSAARFNLPRSPAGLRGALILQAGKGGPVIASRRI
ncbi:DUF1223 domain-containing protein [Sphingomonas sp. RB1R13]|uniref:DUF1223 domain-containing protein n=1 Tax=Sphingomonas sp. RB1R13 TaxID=3096159 RepID=UPI002FCA004A